MKKFALLLVLLSVFGLSVFAEEDVQSVNMTPREVFTGYSNTNARTVYPRINRSNIRDRRDEVMKPRSIHDIAGNDDYSTNKTMPMNYQQMPQNVDSSNMFYNQGLGALQNVQMGF